MSSFKNLKNAFPANCSIHAAIIRFNKNIPAFSVTGYGFKVTDLFIIFVSTTIRRIYDIIKRKWDNRNALAYARKEGKQAGIEEGIREGQKKGEYEKALEMARVMQKDGLSVSVISKYTQLSEEEIGKL